MAICNDNDVVPTPFMSSYKTNSILTPEATGAPDLLRRCVDNRTSRNGRISKSWIVGSLWVISICLAQLSVVNCSSSTGSISSLQGTMSIENHSEKSSSTIKNETCETSNHDDQALLLPVTVRFFLIRHGETIANQQGLVVGQWDSPLSRLGKQQAKALSLSKEWQSFLKEEGHNDNGEKQFWRMYCSNLGRAQETANTIMPSSSLSSWILEPRIREIAKGARQEYPKSWEYQRAVKDRTNNGKEIPLLETSDDAWLRLSDFFANILEDAIQEYSMKYGKIDKEISESMMTLNVIVVSHAGAMRTLLQKMVSNAHPTLQHHDDPSRPPDDSKRLQIPNTSVTILDVTPKRAFLQLLGNHPAIQQKKKLDRDDAFFPPPNFVKNESDQQRGKFIQSQFHDLWSTHVVQFMWTEHLTSIGTTSNDE